jgi:predicted transcriptional regulator
MLQTVADVMEPDVVCVEEVSKVSALYEVLRQTEHNGFPVIQRAPGVRRLSLHAAYAYRTLQSSVSL